MPQNAVPENQMKLRAQILQAPEESMYILHTTVKFEYKIPRACPNKRTSYIYL